VAERIRRESGNPKVDFLIADLAVQAQVRQVAAEFRQRYDRLDVLINNAGAFYMQREVSADGHEMTWALNHLAYFLLTNLLLDMLKASAPARIINVASDAHQGGAINLADPEGKAKYSGWRAYAQSKLANIMFTYELARRLATEPTAGGVTVNTLHPGFIASNFARNNITGWRRPFGLLLTGLQRIAARSPEEGAETIIYLASDPTVAGITGQYFVKKQITKSSAASHDATVAGRLWTLSEQMVGTA
jgi:NAD(P)-dependent dehydrogenase (short-subunit alcohol dehydrogenase family)